MISNLVHRFFKCTLTVIELETHLKSQPLSIGLKYDVVLESLNLPRDLTENNMRISMCRLINF